MGNSWQIVTLHLLPFLLPPNTRRRTWQCFHLLFNYCSPVGGCNWSPLNFIWFPSQKMFLASLSVEAVSWKPLPFFSQSLNAFGQQQILLEILIWYLPTWNSSWACTSNSSWRFLHPGSEHVLEEIKHSLIGCQIIYTCIIIIQAKKSWGWHSCNLILGIYTRNTISELLTL